MFAHLAFAAFVLTATVSMAEVPKIPTTVAEHEALAKQYSDQAAQNKKVADDHRAMAEAAKKSTLDSHAAAHGQRDPNVVKMEKHCAAIAAAADKLATAAQKAADFHEMRAKELQGK
ncbi:MAG: hypothetical protein ABI560_18455 [Myxococcales bacterium]